ncbi:hypothetical protein ACTVCO_12095 [Sanguibacter sp. A247]|uniref:hypothetical protein n=1 Tax=unclassified Sanguibacter TaxID=2645534 RepID=UPI003FD8A5C9
MPTSTVTDVTPPSSLSPTRVRNVGTILLMALILAALLGVFGTRTTVRSVTQDGWTTTVRYAEAARAGLDVPVTITVTREGGFDADVVIAISSDYLRILDQQSTGPEPAEQSRDDTWTYLTFTPPDGDTLKVDIEAYVRALRHEGAVGQVAVIDSAGTLVAPVDIRTRIVP